MPRSLSDKTTRRPKEPFDPALEYPIALIPDHLEWVVGGRQSRGSDHPGGATTGGATTGAKAPRSML
jgi:hypothetical protein